MKRALLTLFILLSVIHITAAASSNTVLNEYVSYDHTFSYGGSEYTITASNTYLDDETQGRVLIRKDGEGVIVNFGECAKTPFYEYCFENRTFEGEHVDIDNQGHLQPALKLKLIEYEDAVGLEAKRIFSTTEFRIDDKIEVEIKLTNDGDLPLLNILIDEQIPPGFVFVSADTFIDRTKTGFTKLLNLYPKSTFTLKYTIQAKEYNETNYESQLTYDVGSEKGIEKSFGAVTLKPIEPYKFTSSEFENTYERGEKERFTITITNNENEPLQINDLEITASPSLRINNKQGLKTRYVNTFGNSEIVEPGDTKIAFIDLQLNNVGYHSVSYKADLTVKGKQYEEKGQENLSVKIDELLCFIEVDTTPTAGEYTNYNVILDNNDDETFYELNVTIDDSVSKTKKNIPNIFPDEEKEIVTKSVLIPFSLEEQTYPFKVSVKYRTIDNQYFTCSQVVNITASAAQANIDIDNSIPSFQVQRGDEVPITTVLRNLVSIPVSDISVLYETVDDQSQTITVDTLSDTKTISKTITIPSMYEQDTYEITVKILQNNKFYDEKTLVMTVTNPYTTTEPSSESPSTQTTQTNTANNVTKGPVIQKLQDEPTQSETDNLNFIQKIVLYIKNFFN